MHSSAQFLRELNKIRWVWITLGAISQKYEPVFFGKVIVQFYLRYMCLRTATLPPFELYAFVHLAFE